MVQSKFAEDVRSGFSKSPKSLSSSYFYDEKGNQLFRSIMDLDEYYPTSCEYEILETRAEEILNPFLLTGEFNLVDFGAGDGKKTKLLIRFLFNKGIPFTYIPIDISLDILQILKKDMEQEFPGISVRILENDYFEALESINTLDTKPKLILFLGSNIGNLSYENSLQFLSRLYSGLHIGDRLLLGADLKKDPATILKAYNDAKGVTREFNLNLLDRMNRELLANFDRNQFYHYPLYDPETGIAKSFLVSKIDQEIYFEVLQTTFSFKQGEPIFLEISQKYSLEILFEWAEKTSFKVIGNFTDHKGYFVDSLWEKI